MYLSFTHSNFISARLPWVQEMERHSFSARQFQFTPVARTILAHQSFCSWYGPASAVLTLDFVQGLGDVLVGVTVGQNSLMTGPGCTVQGFLINSGDVSSAIWSFVIAVHTFVLLAGGSRWRTWAAEKGSSGKARWILCFGVWALVVFIGAFGPVVLQNLHPEKGPYCTLSSLEKV